MDPRLVRIAAISVERLRADMRRSAPFLADGLFRWLEELFAGSPLADRFLDLAAFPIVPLPWWVEESFGTPDEERQEALAVSSMAGYLFIRLIDNVMDGDAPGDPRLLPALAFLSTEFARPYQAWFPPGHPFWADFDQAWVGTADLTARDSHLREVDRETFLSISAQKTGAARIPAAALCHLHSRLEMLSVWGDFVAVYGRFHQFDNDVRSWSRDLETGSATWLLSEAARRKSLGESIPDWLLREGFAWAVTILEGFLADLMRLTQQLRSPGLTSFLQTRQEMVEEMMAAVRDGAAEAKKLSELIAIHRSRQDGTAG